MTPLSPDDFPAFFHEIHGHSPFPWQTRLVRVVVASGAWPAVLDLPTGSGKTAALDVAVFHLATSAGRSDRAAPMRIAFVVDRRLVVDEAYKRAERIRAALLSPGGAITARVAEALRHYSGDEPPLHVERLRGGVPREDDWARTPCQPTILCSTVDQVGSRLMFRGYGVGDRMAPVHAGLLGSDALILLDEAHLSEPFRQTLRAIATVPTLRGRDRAPFGVVLLTATPGKEDNAVLFGLEEADRAEAILAGRLGARKPVSYREVADTDEARGAALAEEAVALADRLRLSGVAAPIVGVICNRVGRARASRDRLRDYPSKLVIGRSRPIDRDRVAAELDGLKTGRDRPASPLMLVGTQALEAGIDVDLDGLVTEAAPLDSLRQRFGRVNRAGRAITAAGVVLGSRRARDADPIYGAATSATIAHLWPGDATVVDFGIDAMAARLGSTVPELLLAPRPDAPVLMPAYVTLWAQTSPRPTADPEPALFLHGADREPASVQVVWRADLDLRLEAELLGDLLTLAPPRSGEVMELPIWAARQWLRGAAPDLADIAEPERGATGSTNRRAFRWAGPGDPRSDVIEAKDIRPGDLLVVPARHGGCDEYGWAPDEMRPVTDLYDKASKQSGGRMDVVRIKAELMRSIEGEDAFDGAALTKTLTALGDHPRGSEVIDAVRDLVPGGIADHLDNLARDKARAFFPYAAKGEDRPGVIIVTPRESTAFGVARTDTGGGVTGDDDAASFPGEEQTLRAHTDAVERVVRRFADGMGLDPASAHDLALAASLHDAGKADRRFQRVLKDAAPFAPAANEPLAKSKKGATPRAWNRAGLKRGWRHEALSVRLALLNPRLQRAHDRALVLFLVGSHHGYGRPFFPHVDEADAAPRSLVAVDGLVPPRIDAAAGPQSLAFVVEGEAWAPTLHDANDLRGLDWFTMIRELQERYGPWGLARLEATLRLADHRASAEGGLTP